MGTPEFGAVQQLRYINRMFKSEQDIFNSRIGCIVDKLVSYTSETNKSKEDANKKWEVDLGQSIYEINERSRGVK